jgi:tetratricopeptide (TPR) repeat protein
MLAEIVQRAPASYRIYHGICQSYGGSYQPWHAIWQEFFGIDRDDDAETRRGALERRLTALAPQLALRAPLLALPLQIAIPDNDLTRTLDPQLRDRLLKSLLVACVRAEARRAPILFVLDDCHWIDSLSQELLELMSRSIADLPVALVLAGRTHTEGTRPLAWLAQLSHAQVMPLDELPDNDVAALIKQIWSQRFETPVPPEDVLAELQARAHGNPLYLEELITFIHDRGVTPGQPASLDLPDSLQQLILSRIDRLEPRTQTALKAASVIGAQVPASWLAEGFPQLGEAAAVSQQIESLRRQELLTLERTLPQPEYRFRHTLLRDTAYESLAFATRAMLHEQLADYIGRRYAADLASQLDALAYHYGRSGNTGQQRVYFRRAGDAARAAYANVAAIDYYQRLLPLLEPAEQSPVLHALSEVWRFTGEWQQAEEYCRRALALAEAAGDRRAVAECARTLGALVGRTQSYEAALPWLEQARAINQADGDLAGLSRVLELLSFAHYQLGNTRQALADAERQLEIATTIGDSVGRSDALAQIGLVAAQLGDVDRALEVLRQSLHTAERAGYRRRTVLAANDIAGIYWQIDNFPRALEWLLKAIGDAEEIGYIWVIGLMIGNAGMIYARQGEDDQALACYVRALQIALDLGDGPGIVPSLGQIASLFAGQGRYEMAAPICARAIAMARELALPYELCEQLELRAQLLAQAKEYTSALAACSEARELAERIEEGEVAARAGLLELRLRVAAGELTVDAACDVLDSALNAAPDDTARAAICMAIWQLDPHRTDAQSSAAGIYRQRYQLAPSAELRWRYAALAGENLPAPPALPALPPMLLGTSASLGDLLARAGV